MAEKSRSERISRAFSSLLRHKALVRGLPVKSNGFVPLDAVLALPEFKNTSVNDIVEIVRTNAKQRFTLQDDGSGLMEIRANQGHTFEVPDLDLRLINDSSEFSSVVHGTYYSAWNHIKTEGLKRMNRTHIHFACGLPNDNHVISGMRGNCQVVIYIDLAKAINDGFQFFISSNKVILCSGKGPEGTLPPQYFQRVVDARSKTDLL